jgi:hypothetical protein
MRPFWPQKAGRFLHLVSFDEIAQCGELQIIPLGPIVRKSISVPWDALFRSGAIPLARTVKRFCTGFLLAGCTALGISPQIRPLHAVCRANANALGLVGAGSGRASAFSTPPVGARDLRTALQCQSALERDP